MAIRYPDGVYEPANNNIQNHISSTSNPHSTTKTQVGLGNVDDVQQLPMSYLDTDGTLSSNSDSKVPSQKAVKTYADNIGKIESINIETLTGNKTLTVSDSKVQILNAGGGTRNITLPTTDVPNGLMFIICNTTTHTSSYYLYITNTGDCINSGCTLTFIYASGWKSLDFSDNISIGYGSNNNYSSGIGIGYNATYNYASGIGIGYNATYNYASGIGIGYNASYNSEKALGIGYNASANYKGEATVAIGSYSQANVNREVVFNSDSNTNNYSSFIIQKYKYKDLNSNSGAWQELFVDGGSSNRRVLTSRTLHNFLIQISAIDKTNYTSKAWECKGAIKRDNSNNTTLVGSITKTVIGADTGTSNWDVQITADDTNEALKVEVKHDSSNQVRFALNILITKVGV